MTQVRHKCDTNDMSATQMENFDFHNETSKNIFSQPYINYMASERLKRRGIISELPSGNALLPCQYTFEECTAKS